MATSQTINLTPITPPAAFGTTSSHTNRLTVWDMVEHLRDFLGADVEQQVPRVVRRAIREAADELVNSHNWSYFYMHGRVSTNAPYSTGTIAFDYTGGAYERMLTLTTGTWPTWAANAYIRIGDVVYLVDRRISNSVVTLDPTLTPVSDISSGTSYTLYQDTYLLPEDFVSMHEGLSEISWYGMEYVHPSEWLRVHRFITSFSNTPRFYTVMGSPDVPGRMCLRIFPYPDSAKTIDFVYKRRHRPFSLERYETGTATVDASGGATASISGTGTVWTSSMEGSVIRLSADALKHPTGWDGDNPFSVERNIKIFTSATAVAADDSISTSYTAVKYRISDPIDIENGAMRAAYYRCCEKHAAVMRNFGNRGEIESAYQMALVTAKEADSRSMQLRVAGASRSRRQRLADMPRGSDIS